MELKIVEVAHTEEQHDFKTFICQADDIRHERVYYDSKDDFINKYNKITKDLTGGVIGIPDEYWKGENVKAKGYFIFCLYQDKHDELRFIVFENRKMYITNKGTTVDVVE